MFAEALAAAADLPVEQVLAELGAPPRPEMGQLAWPCFQLAKAARRPPQVLATEIAARVALTPPLLKVEAQGPYVNAHLDGAAVAAQVVPAVLAAGDRYGSVDDGQGAVVCVDFSSPNIAKSFGVHHVRSTVIGHALCGLLEAAGHRTVGINHLGDWGTQFGQLLTIWEEQGNEAELAQGGIDYLLKLYVEFNTRKEADPSLQETARARFKALEDGDPECRRLWALFRAVSLTEFERVYAMLGIRFDDTRGESFYESRMAAVLAELEAKGLLTSSQDATVVDLTDEGLGAALVRKGDGSTLYLTRDLASADFRQSEYGFVRSLYVVGGAQSLHFQQMIAVLKRLGRTWADAIEHVPFGLMRFKDRKMSTRKGDIIPLEEVLNRAVDLARQTVQKGADERGEPAPADIDQLAHRIGVGAVVFNDLKNRRARDVTFDWDELLSFEGETGPYLQYTAARIASMIEKAERPLNPGFDSSLLAGNDELRLCLSLDGLCAALRRSVAECEPSFMSDQLLEISARFSTLYSNRNWKVISEDGPLTDARLALAAATQQALLNGLTWLGIPVPDRM